MNREQPHLVESATLRYLLSLPPGDAPAGGWPVLCFLHGYDEAAPLEIHRALTAHGPLRPGSAPQATRQFIVVAPQLRAPGGDVWRHQASEVQQIVRQVQALHRGDPQRTYLTGFSFGGNGVFDLAALLGGMWAALWAVDPTRVPAQDPGLPVWLSFGEVARYRKAGFVRQLRLEPTPDDICAERVGLDEGEDHVGSAAGAYRDERIYRWLLEKRLVADG